MPITEAQALLSYQKDKDIVAKAASELDATKDERRTTKEDQALTTDH